MKVGARIAAIERERLRRGGLVVTFGAALAAATRGCFSLPGTNSDYEGRKSTRVSVASPRNHRPHRLGLSDRPLCRRFEERRQAPVPHRASMVHSWARGDSFARARIISPRRRAVGCALRRKFPRRRLVGFDDCGVEELNPPTCKGHRSRGPKHAPRTRIKDVEEGNVSVELPDLYENACRSSCYRPRVRAEEPGLPGLPAAAAAGASGASPGASSTRTRARASRAGACACSSACRTSACSSSSSTRAGAGSGTCSSASGASTRTRAGTSGARTRTRACSCATRAGAGPCAKRSSK